MVVSPIWECMFFCHEVDDEELEDFDRCMRQVCGGSSVKDILRRIRVDKNLRSKLRHCYCKYIACEINHSSLALYHGCVVSQPVMIQNYAKCFTSGGLTRYLETIPCFNRACLYFMQTIFSGQDCGQLLTGDLNLKTRKFYKAFRRHFNKKLGSVTLCLLPHHGSEYCWNRFLLQDISQCTVWVASAGIRNNYGHPSKDVMEQVLSSGSAFFWVNEYSLLKTRFVINVYR